MKQEQFLMRRRTSVCMCVIVYASVCLELFIFPYRLFVFFHTLPYWMFTQMLSFNLFLMWFMSHVSSLGPLGSKTMIFNPAVVRPRYALFKHLMQPDNQTLYFM